MRCANQTFQTRCSQHDHCYTVRRSSGFALVATVSMMVLLTMIALGMLSLATLEQRSSGGTAAEADQQARANARMALMIALGELQKAAGPDQRVTATASILGNANNTGYSVNGGTTEYIKDTSAKDGRKHWVGVWDCTNYSPADPDNKPFMRWLVSGSEDPTGANLNSLTAVGDPPNESTPPAPDDDVVIFEGVNAAGTVKVPKVEVATTAGNKSYYAYWVEDEGVKVDLNWYEVAKASTGSDDSERAQARRLSAMPAQNYWLTPYNNSALGPFRDANDDNSTSDKIVNGAMGTPSNSAFYDNIKKVSSAENIPLVAGGSAAHRDWLKGIRHSRGFNNRGVLADVKQGGLRRDLTLAFEMDGDDDVDTDGVADADTDILGNFNQQVGEFVGGSDKNASGHDYPAAAGLPRARHLFREARNNADPTLTTDGPFADKIYVKTTFLDNRHQPVLRGPTWWTLRDYYNLYKRLEKSGSNYRMKARAYYPNRATIGSAASDMLDTIYHWADHRDTDYRKPHQGVFAGQWKYVFRPARASYAPVYLGTTAILSVAGDNYNAANQTAEIVITLDPIHYFWNPYNREIKVDNLMLHIGTGLPGTVNVQVNGPVFNADGTPKLDADDNPVVNSLYSPDLWQLMSCNLANYHIRSGRANYGFMINEAPGAETDPFVLAPGEVVAASPSATSGQSYLGYDPLNNNSGIFMDSIDVAGYAHPSWDPKGPNGPNTTDWTQRQVRASVVAEATSINLGYHDPKTGQPNRFYLDSSLAPAGTTASIFTSTNSIAGEQVQHKHMQIQEFRNEYNNGQTEIYSVPLDFNTLVNFNEETGEFLGGVKQQFALFNYLVKPVNWSGSGANPTEVFSRWNPAAMVTSKDYWAAVTPNMLWNFITDDAPNDLVSQYGLNFSTSPRNAFWGKSYDSSGQTSVPMSNIPSSPLLSIVDFGHANLGTMAEDPFHSVGNSLPSPVISPIAPYGTVSTGGREQTNGTGTDLSWHLNDALFDRYFLSGIVPEYSISTTGYNATGSLSDTLHRFYGMNPSDTAQRVDPDTAQASPVMEAHVPEGKSPAEIVSELLETTMNDTNNATPGYKKMAAYSLLKGGFNVNSTADWGGFMRGSNGQFAVKSYDGSSDSRSSYLGFPQSSSPSPPAGTATKQTWTGWSRLGLKGAINNLAGRIASEVKERGPFMSVSDFVNRKVGGSTITNHHKKGAVQAGVDAMTTNSSVYGSAGGVTTDYGKHGPLVPSTTENANTAAGIPGSVTQANVLRNIAPRLTARSDTFRIRGYGEVTDADGNIIAKATCEALVQRLPEYVDSKTYEDYNEPWDVYDPAESVPAKNLNPMNQKYGRRFEIQSFRWLDDSEV